MSEKFVCKKCGRIISVSKKGRHQKRCEIRGFSKRKFIKQTKQQIRSNQFKKIKQRQPMDDVVSTD